MTKSPYTNRELAQDYYKVVAHSPYKDVQNMYRTMMERISGLDVDLVEFFHQQRSFDDLNVGGIGKKTKKVLELILEHGVEEARRVVGEEREERSKELVRQQWSRIPSRAPKQGDDTPPSWDNAVRQYERH